ncbi:MAG: TniQ family protein [Streptomyces sp.]|nr:TniQ family protein [Streptomyces sp.]
MHRNVTSALPRSLDPLQGESLPGFLLRLSYRLERSPHRIAQLLGLAPGYHRLPYAHLRSLPDDLARSFAATARLTDEEAQSLTLQRFSRTYPALLSVRENTSRINGPAQVGWTMSPSSRYCPQCLRGDGSPIQNALGGAWQLRWHLPVAFACTRHGRLLEHECPSCGVPLNSPEQRRAGLLKQPSFEGLHPLQCRNRTVPPDANATFKPRPLCSARLDRQPDHESSNLTAEDLQLLLKLQERIDERLRPPIDGTDSPAAADAFFPDLITATHLIKLSWPTGRQLLPSDTLAAIIDTHTMPFLSVSSEVDGASNAVNFRRVRNAPADSAACGALLLAAGNLLANRDMWAFSEKTDPLASETYRRSKSYARKIAREPGISKDFARAMSPRTPRLRGNNKIYRTLRHAYTFSIAEVPPYLPRAWYLKHFAELRAQLPNATFRDDRMLRRGAAFRLAELGSGKTWAECAISMGITAGVADNAQRMLGHRLADSHLWPLFTHTVEQIADVLDAQENRIDYANRRRSMRHWRMPDTDRDRLFDNLHRLEHMQTQADPRITSIIVWSDVTQSEPLRCPIVVAARSAGDAPALITAASHLHEAYLGHGQRYRLRRRLNLYATYLARYCDQDEALSVDTDVVVAQETNRLETLQARDPDFAVTVE